MECMDFTTIGEKIYPGHEVKIRCFKDTDKLVSACPQIRYRIAYVKEGHGIFHNGNKSQMITSPMVLCLNEEDEVSISNAEGIEMDVMYFDPICFDRYIEYDSLEAWKKELREDEFFFMPFFQRTDSYIGACATNYKVGNRIAKLISLADNELSNQVDSFWPCRSRSYFIELLLTVNSVYCGDRNHEKIFEGELSKEVTDVVDWVHIHYLEKIKLEDITKEFHTNKTTLNQRFKLVMGITVMEYMISLRMQIACSLLRKTYLTINEIMEHSGYRDNAHFLRAFKKFTGLTPSEYRNQFENEA